MKLIRIGVGPHPSPQQCRSAFPKSCSVVWLGFVQWWWLEEQRKGRLHAHEMFKTDSLEAKAGIRGLAGWSVSSTVLCLLWAPPQLSSVPLLMSPHVSSCLSSFKVYLLNTKKMSLWLDSAAPHLMPMGMTSQSPPGASLTVWMRFPRPVHPVPR